MHISHFLVLPRDFCHFYSFSELSRRPRLHFAAAIIQLHEELTDVTETPNCCGRSTARLWRSKDNRSGDTINIRGEPRSIISLPNYCGPDLNYFRLYGAPKAAIWPNTECRDMLLDVSLVFHRSCNEEEKEEIN